MIESVSAQRVEFLRRTHALTSLGPAADLLQSAVAAAGDPNSIVICIGRDAALRVPLPRYAEWQHEYAFALPLSVSCDSAESDFSRLQGISERERHGAIAVMVFYGRVIPEGYEHSAL